MAWRFPASFNEPITARHESSLRCMADILMSVYAVVTECSENIAGKILPSLFQFDLMRGLPIIQTKIAGQHCARVDGIHHLLD
jgi:hypothetical protein